MKRVFISLFLFILLSCTDGTHSISTKLNSAIDSTIRNEVNNVVNTLLLSIKNGDSDTFKTTLSNKLLTVLGGKTDSVFGEMNNLFSEYDFEIFDEYYSKVAKNGNNNSFTIIPSLSEKSKLIINNITFYSNESYNIFLRSTNKDGIQYLLYLSLSLYNKKWKINVLQICDYSINEQNAVLLFEKSIRLKNENKTMSSAMFALAGNTLLRPKEYLQYPDEPVYKKHFESIIKESNTEYQFPIKITEQFDLFSINIKLMQQGVIPVVAYTTTSSLKDTGKIEQEAQEISREVYKIMPDLETEFSLILFKAFSELPVKKDKKYNTYTTIIKNQ